MSIRTNLVALSAFVVIVMLQQVTVISAITCYHCSGESGRSIPDTTYNDCGLPFKDNTTNQFTPLATVTCEGVCVVNTIFEAGAVPSTKIYRTCTDVPVTDGCEYSVSNSIQKWSCIKTCDTNKCNTGSDSTTLIPPTVAQLLVLSIAGLVSRL